MAVVVKRPLSVVAGGLGLVTAGLALSAAWCVSRESSGPARVPFPGSVHAAWWATSQPMWHPYPTPPCHRGRCRGLSTPATTATGPTRGDGSAPAPPQSTATGPESTHPAPATPSARKPPDPAPAPGDATRRCRRSPHPQQRASPPHRPAPGHGHAPARTSDAAIPPTTPPVRPVRSANKRTATDPAWALMCKAVQHLQIMLSIATVIMKAALFSASAGG